MSTQMSTLITLALFDEVLRQLHSANKKLNLLVENAGMGDKLATLTEELRGPTDSLASAVAANQPPKQKEM